jgi:hypothetical protein
LTTSMNYFRRIAMSSAPFTAKSTGLAGLVLLLLGFVSMWLVWAAGDPTAQRVQLAAGAGVLVGLGASSAVASGLQRLEQRVAALEARAGAPREAKG